MDVGRAWELIQSAGADPLEVARACEVVKAAVDARQLEAIQQVSVEQPGFLDDFGQLCEPAAAELACALAWTPFTATRRVALAEDLHHTLPGLLDALRAGLIDLTKVQEITRGTALLSPGTRRELAQRAVDYAAAHTRGQLRAWLARHVARLDPQAAEKRRRTARKERRIWVQPDTDGMATLGAYLTAEEAQACYESIRLAVSNHEGGIDAARADELVARLSGLSPADPVPVQVIITPTGTELAGHGPVSPTHAHDLCDGAPRITFKQAPPATIGYRPGLTLARYVKARDRHCRFPGCRRPAVHCDLDHITPFPDGPTDARNLQCLCRYHHRLKTHTGWTVQATHGHLEWTSPRGHKYRSRADDP